jgi:hypothetical protein
MMEKRLSRGENPKGVEPSRGESRPGEQAKSEGTSRSPAGGENNGEDHKEEVWKKFVAFVMTEKKVLASHLERVRPLGISPGQLKIGVEERYHLGYLQDAENLSSLKELACRFFSREVAVGITSVPPGKRELRDEAANGSSPLNEAENNMVRETLRIFGGSVKEIKKGN